MLNEKLIAITNIRNNKKLDYFEISYYKQEEDPKGFCERFITSLEHILV